MSEDSKQLSVAELLARNGQQGAGSSGGGRRRRGGRGLSVAELTGDLPVIDGGRSAHSAPDEEAAEPEPPASYGVNGYGPASAPTHYPAPSYESPAPQPASYEPDPVYSPMSGPITRFDPLAGETGTEPQERRRSRHSAPESDSGPIVNGQPLSTDVAGSGRTGRRRRRADPDDEYDAEPQAPATTHETDPMRRSWQPAPEAPNGRDSSVSGRAARRRAAEAAEAQAAADAQAAAEAQTRAAAAAEAAAQANAARARATRPEVGSPPAAWTPPANGYGPAPAPQWQPTEQIGPPAPLSSQDPGPATAAWTPPPVNGYSPGPQPPDDQSQATAAWSPTINGFAPSPKAEPEPPVRDTRPELPRRREAQGENGLPAWSARRHRPGSGPETGGIPTSAWSLASQDQQLVSGQTVAGDLLRDGAERAAAGRKGRGRGDVVEPDDQRTDFFAPVADDDLDHDEADDFYDDDDLLDEELDDEDEAESSWGRRTAALSRTSSSLRRKAGALGKVKTLAGAKAATLGKSSSAGAVPAARGTRSARKAEYDANKRQWMILGGQSAGAAVAGMLLFKGFERMWEMLPWVALALAMVVILGLVALVRILRRTDDILSTVIAVVVGIFVTLGPLAFLLSTN
ncbi:hypothetical protein GV794_12485 [Nocardia cyriacigeorgica]|uniref:Uncharacterized protein n=1 Tax=Nocardia cyriacigeorgica TaxID=135487 RepID=A0A6P1D368_9NOCA|nr:hypothetical protein [Nocardia cyriacigeorgica]NEW39500.1 hypothetical protein [Nocardia cyriacigeorgica]NEW43914.1 hypothetical protein [Nocardia cyriacigeorgica]NEW49989.1 hypothetical protein [Nocardia cyriacigeorgica]NEW56462.1 hypothetical protein [Nocardia cyriacigeorgica]